MPKGLNLQSVKSRNRTSVLYLLNEHGKLSRKELAKRLLLTPAAVTKICAELILDGHICEQGFEETEGRSGRKEILLVLKTTDKYAFCVNAERGAITYALAGIDGKLIKSNTSKFENDVNKVIENCKSFLSDCAEFKDKIIGAGICIIGDIQDRFGVWKTDGLQKKFESALGMEVTIDNNVKAFAESELIYGDIKNNKSVIFFKWGYGVGSSIVVNGRVFSGNDSGVTEIGHYIVNPNGVKCRCGRRGCLETEVSADAILKEIDNENLTADMLATTNDDNVRKIVDEKAKIVALALTNTATVLNANDVVLFGTMFANQSTVDVLKKQCVEFGCSAENMQVSTLNDRRSYIGAVAICAKKFFFER